MPRLSVEGAFGIAAGLLLFILDKMEVGEAPLYVILFLLAAGLCIDSVLRSRWGNRRKRRTAVGLIFVSYLGLGSWVFLRPHELTSDLEVIKYHIFDFSPDRPINGELTYHNRSSRTIEFYSTRRFIVGVLPRNEESTTLYIDKNWDAWVGSLNKEGVYKLRIEPNGVNWVSLGRDEDRFVPSFKLFELAEANHAVLSLVVMGFLQYSDRTGTHQTDYCFIYQGKPDVYLSCNTHIGPSKPTVLK